MHVHLCVASWLFSPRLSCPLLRPTVLLPALPDVYLSVQREVQVQPPVRLPLGDRGRERFMVSLPSTILGRDWNGAWRRKSIVMVRSEVLWPTQQLRSFHPAQRQRSEAVRDASEQVHCVE